MLPPNTENNKWKPGVSKSTLLFIAGMLWLGMGTILVMSSLSWLKLESLEYASAAFLIGFILALVIHHFGFLRIVDKNLGRILPVEGEKCVFSFMPWKSYILIFIMILMGALLRHSTFPKLYLSIIYISIGAALILSSIRYLRYLVLSFFKGNH